MVDPHATTVVLMTVGVFGVVAAIAFIVKCAR